MAKSGQLNRVKDGLVQRAPGRWSYIVRLPDERTGKTRQKWVSRDEHGQPFPTRAAAKAARDQARHELHKGTYVLPSQQTLGGQLTEWLDALHRTRGNRKARRQSTISNYRTVLSSYVLRYPIAERELRQLTRQGLEAHWDDVAQTGAKGGGPLAARTVQYAHQLVSSALLEAVEDGKLARNPAARVGLPQSVKPKRDKGAWTADELALFLSSTSDDRMHGLWSLMANTGMRRGEALALRWEDIDLNNGTARIHRALAEVDGDLVDHDSPKNRRERTVPLNDAARAALRSWRKRQAEERLHAGPAWQGADDGGVVFTKEDGARVPPKSASYWFDCAVRAVDELPKLSLHELRHTCATLLLSSGHPVHLVAQLLGHDPAVLLSTYAHLLPTDSHRLVDALDGMLAEAQ